MREINAETTAAYLVETGRLPSDSIIRVQELAGGVSNIVLRVDVAGRDPLVIKQCRERLRVAMEWHARLDRIWAERATLDVLTDILPAGLVPRVLFEDRDDYLFAMSCAPEDSVTWKSRLMAGETNPTIAADLGRALALIHERGRNHPTLQGTLADTSLFEELRVDPYYRTTAQAHADLAPRIDALIGAMELPRYHRTLVLGDFSPKNILVHSDGLMLLDFECGHAGDPAFDLGFFLSHLLLKTIHRARIEPGQVEAYTSLVHSFWEAYRNQQRNEGRVDHEREARGVWHAGACVLARVDGKSPVEYLNEPQRERARGLGRSVLADPPATVNELTRTLVDSLSRTSRDEV
jgi:5-methylthioribose kinase